MQIIEFIYTKVINCPCRIKIQKKCNFLIDRNEMIDDDKTVSILIYFNLVFEVILGTRLNQIIFNKKNLKYVSSLREC